MEIICANINEQKNNLTIENIHDIIQLLQTLKTQHPEYRQPKYEYDYYGNICSEIPQEMDYCIMCNTDAGGKLCKGKHCNAYLCQDCEKMGCVRCKECNQIKDEIKYNSTKAIRKVFDIGFSKD
jgi:hypothetical protein